MYTFLPLISTIISLIFTLLVFIQYLYRRKPHQLLWTIGLLMYSIGTLTEFWTEIWGVNEVIYRCWYLFGAILVSAYLGMGTVYLLTRRRIAHIIMAVLGIASAYAAYRVMSVPLDLSSMEVLTGKNIMPDGIRMMTPFFNSFGTFSLVGGALYSSWIFWRKKIMFYRVISNILIAVGAILPAVGGTQLRLGGQIGVFYLFELIGILIIFVGFLRSSEVFGLGWLPASRKARIPSK